ncbi:MAG: PAS domain S-box protein [Alphaproteobacteria bacterium]
MTKNLAVSALPHGAIDIGEALRLLADRLRDLVCYVDSDEIVRYVNRTGADWWGYAPDDAIGRDLDDLLGGYYDELRPLYRRALNGETIETERSVDHPDGRHREVFLTMTPHRDHADAVIGVLVVSEDRSSLAGARAEMRQHQALTDEALAHLAQGMLVFDGAHKLRLWNEQAHTLRDYPRDFLRDGLSYREVLQHNLDAGLFGDVDHRQFLARVTSPEAMALPARLEFSLANGNIVDMQRAPLPGGGFVLTYTDITEAKRVEAKLRDSEQRFRLIVQRLPVPATIVRIADGQVLFRNPEAEQQLVDFRRQGLFAANSDIQDMWTSNLAKWLELPDDGGFRQQEFPVRVNGQQLWFLAAGQRLEYDGEPCLFVTWINITEAKISRAALERSEANLAEAQRIASFGSWQHDLTTDRAVWSAHYFTLLGLPADAPPSYQTILELVHPADRDDYNAFFTTAMREGAGGAREYRIVHPDGRVRTLRTIFHIDRDENGAATRVAGTTQDITDLREAQSALEESEARLRQASTLASLGRWVWDAVADRCTYCSEENAEIHGMSVEAYMRDAAQLDQEFMFVHADDRERVEGHYAKLRQGEPFDIQYRIVTPAGEVRHLHELAMPVFDDDGRVVEEYGVAQDVTRLLETERALAASEARFRAVVNQSPIAFVLTDADGRVQLVNRTFEDWFSVAASDAVGAPCRDLVPPELAPGIDQVTAAVVADGKPREMELELPAEGAAARVLLCSAFPIRDGDGTITGIGHLAVDVTAQRHAEERLRHSQKMEAVGQITGGVAHDFNNLLTAVIGNLDLLALNVAADDDSRRLIDTAIRAAQRGGRLTQQLLAFSRKQVLDPVPTDLNEAVNEVLPLARTSTRGPIHIATQLTTAVKPVAVDRGQLENALLNLVINARDALPDGGEITISTANQAPGADLVGPREEIAPGEYVMIAVADNGAGMSARTRAQAVEPFFTTKPVGQGSGLGLSMVFGFVKQSGGHLAITSTPGKGTTVRLFLPISEATSAVRVRDEAGDSFGQARGEERILVVEDDADVRRFAASVLQRLGYDVLQAEDGEAAMALIAARDSIDLLLTDVVLPGTAGGTDVADAFQARFPHGRVLFTSGHVGDGKAPDGPILEKPYRIDTLAQRIREALDAARS